MLKEIFLTNELMDNLRIIYKAKTIDKESFELIKINNEFDEVIMMPISFKTLYDIYVLLGRNLKKEFNETLDEEPSKYIKYMEFKEHDMYVKNQLTELLESSTKKSTLLRHWFQRIFPSRNALIDEFDRYKLYSFMSRLYLEEETLLDVYYISNYLADYDDIDIDFEAILITSINEYTKMVSEKDGGHYPEVNDIGTAQDYFTSIIYRSDVENELLDGKLLGRLYYRVASDNKLISFVNDTYKSSRDNTSILCMGFWFGAIFGEWCFREINLVTFIYFVTMLFVISVIPFMTRRKRIVNKLKNITSHEHEILLPLASKEYLFFKKRYM